MPLNKDSVRKYLKENDFKNLFTRELGWDNYTGYLDVFVDGIEYKLNVFIEKHGFYVLECKTDNIVPGYPVRRKIERQVSKYYHEHLIIFTDKNIQVWQWVKTEIGKPIICREHIYHKGQSGEALIQKIENLSVSLEEEENLTLIDVTTRTRKAFDVDKITKRFYERFKNEHSALLKFIKGIPEEELNRWYASVMLNRLMFIYFIQKKGFLNNDPDYLKNKLHEIKLKGKDLFYSDFLCPLFFEGFAKKESERSEKTNKLLGKIPYLNGGLFLKHQIEESYGNKIHISDTAFTKLFAFFDDYNWHLDERPLKNDNEINPDVLGYIFEKYINQKQMGAYYTKEDITEYIGKNTIIPFLFDTARKNCAIAFAKDSYIWQILHQDPNRYIYDAVRHGIDKKLPEEVAIGLNDVPKRTEWNKYAPSDYALPTEIWRDVVERRKRYNEIFEKIKNGEIYEINDFITYNLNIRQFAQDVIENCEGPELLRSFWNAIQNVTILDPTCGSGAFLFAALNILEPLYEACIEKMEMFVEESSQEVGFLDLSDGRQVLSLRKNSKTDQNQRFSSSHDEVGTYRENLPGQQQNEESHTKPVKKDRLEKFSDFKIILDNIDKHPNLKYFILKSIILNNLHGVDIMEEAIEICKLRLFLKLVAQIDSVNLVEPLPDIDFNIKCGNTLVGFATFEEVKKRFDTSLGLKWDSEMLAEKIAKEVEDFHSKQLETTGKIDIMQKEKINEKLTALRDTLDDELRQMYKVNKKDIKKWKSSHQPFHWCAEFFRIINSGGFDVIIGNPPYVEYTDIQNTYSVKNYLTESCGNLFAYTIERAFILLNARRFFGFIVPISSICTPRMKNLIEYEKDHSSFIYTSNFAVRPDKLFSGTDMNLTIHIAKKGDRENSSSIYTTDYLHWYVNFRNYLFSSIQYGKGQLREDGLIFKIQSSIGQGILKKILTSNYSIFSQDTTNIFIYYHSGGRYFRKCILKKISSEYKPLPVTESNKYQIIALLSSSIYFWYWVAFSDTYHVTKPDIDSFRFPKEIVNDLKLKYLGKKLINDLEENRIIRKRKRKDGSIQREVNYLVGKSKHLIDQIDTQLAQYYGFTDEELDFIINYDIKYRMGGEE